MFLLMWSRLPKLEAIQLQNPAAQTTVHVVCLKKLSMLPLQWDLVRMASLRGAAEVSEDDDYFDDGDDGSKVGIQVYGRTLGVERQGWSSPTCVGEENATFKPGTKETKTSSGSVGVANDPGLCQMHPDEPY
jgi:hypothetical protein